MLYSISRRAHDTKLSQADKATAAGIRPGTLHAGEEITPGTLHAGEEIDPYTLHSA